MSTVTPPLITAPERWLLRRVLSGSALARVTMAWRWMAAGDLDEVRSASEVSSRAEEGPDSVLAAEIARDRAAGMIDEATAPYADALVRAALALPAPPPATLCDLVATMRPRGAAEAALLLHLLEVSSGDPAHRKGVAALAEAICVVHFARRLRRLRAFVQEGIWPLSAEMSPIAPAELLSRSRESLSLGRAVDRTLLADLVGAVERSATRAWSMFEACDGLPEILAIPSRGSVTAPQRAARGVLRLLLLRGHLDLLATGLWHYETLLAEPPVTAARHLRSGIAALLRQRFGPFPALPTTMPPTDITRCGAPGT